MSPHLPPLARALNRAWPLPALLAWAAAWAVLLALRGGPLPVALLAATATGALLAWPVQGRWRRIITGAGFPLSALALGAGGPIPAWAWLCPMGLLLLLYPVQAWRDAPVYPTSAQALSGLDGVVGLPPGARILDAGCGLGHALRALRVAWPQGRIDGLERSALLALASRLRCPWADVRRGDMWAVSWSGYALVYLFQRPESMARAWHKANADIGAQGWLASLEFEVPGVAPHAVLHHPGQRPLHIYRLVGAEGAVLPQPRRGGADNPLRPAHARAAG